MNKVKVALVAHHNYKQHMYDWVRENKELLAQNELYATGYTGSVLEKLELNINKFKGGPVGGDIELANAILNQEIDVLIFFCDWVRREALDIDPNVLLRAASVTNIPLALNASSADWITQSPLFGITEYQSKKDDLVTTYKLPPSATETEIKDALEQTLPDDDIRSVTEEFAAIVEKYQSSGHESLLKHLASMLAAKRNCKWEDVIEELRGVLDVTDEKRELLKRPMLERIEYIVDQTIEQNRQMAKDVLDKNVNIADLLAKVKENAMDTAKEKRFVLRIKSSIIAFGQGKQKCLMPGLLSKLKKKS